MGLPLMPSQVTAIIAAGGRGRRFGADVPKQLLVIGGRPVLQWSVEAFLASDRIHEVVVAAPAELVDDPPSYLVRDRVRVVAGGERRQDSVANGFDAADPGSDVILIHDAARPFVDASMIAQAVDAASESGAAIVAVEARDTIKWSPPESTNGEFGGRVIDRTLSRDSIFMAQTPQAFRRDVLAAAVAWGRSGSEVTDEAGLAEQLGYPVRLVAGSSRNLKITTPDDLVIAEAFARGVSGQTGGGTMRVGTGYDLHRLVVGRPLVLGGILIPHELGLAGHSDADAVCHAVTDALLGAAAAGDIGQHFPDTDERWRGASSIDLLAAVRSIVEKKGYRVVNVDVTVIMERPKLGAYRAAMTEKLAAVLGVSVDAIGLKAKTNEGVDACGRGEAVAVHAAVLLERR
jgi:2-C-methyl-D-erythritol 4-phosphate cytidylyltransferase / 2-C-methyl-D-erythritol 2,4-cyclodiphosphate synthase